jgi:hypothetical protein
MNVEFENVRPGDHVTIRTPQGQTRSGRVVMLGTHGPVLNLGGKHGTPGVATPTNFVCATRKGGSVKKTVFGIG